MKNLLLVIATVALPSTATAQFGPLTTLPEVTDSIRDIDFADFDNDGDFDLLSASIDDNKLVWFRNNGTALIAQPPLIHGQDKVWLAKGTDINGDGNTDIVAGSFTDKAVAWYAGDGAGGFGTMNLISILPDHPEDFAVGDMDGDGDIDIVVPQWSPGGLLLFRNDGAGVFTESTLFSGSANRVRAVALGDLDGDGDLDVVVPRPNNLRVNVFLNQGSGALDAGTVIGFISEASFPDIELMHVNGDGLLDVVWTSDGTSLNWVRNLGGGNFAPSATLLLTVGAPYDITAADLDLDGDDDIVVCADTPGSIVNPDLVHTYLNDGLGQFSSAIVVATGIWRSSDVLASDLDGDGDPEIAIADLQCDRVRWTKNLVTVPLDAVSYCNPAVSNSTGSPSAILAMGDNRVVVNQVTLQAISLPLNVFAYFLGSRMSEAPSVVPGSIGNLCLGGAIGRFNQVNQIAFTGIQGIAELNLDLQVMPGPGGPSMVVAGETWYFQGWHRDPLTNPASNFTPGLAVTFQ